MTSAKRSIAAPELPTIAESGLPGFEAATWFALLAPARTPNEITTRLNAIITKFSHTPEMRDLLVSQATAEPMSENTVQVGTFIKNEIVKWKKVVVASGARVDE